MLDLTQITAFLAAAIALTLMPGPDIIFVAAQSMSRSRLSGIAVALGLCTGLIIHTGAAALGISAVIASSQTAFPLVKILGSLYLLYLAWSAWRNRNIVTDATLPRARADKRSGFFHLYRRGIVMNLFNPKVLLFFLALLPQFTDVEKGALPLQMLQLGFLFIAVAIVIFCSVSLFSSYLGHMLTNRSSRWSKRLAVIEALIYLLLALNIVFL